MPNNDVMDNVKQGTGIARGNFLIVATWGLEVNNRITGAPTATRFLGGTDAGNNN